MIKVFFLNMILLFNFNSTLTDIYDIKCYKNLNSLSIYLYQDMKEVRYLYIDDLTKIDLENINEYILETINKKAKYVYFLIDFLNINSETINTFKKIKSENPNGKIGFLIHCQGRSMFLDQQNRLEDYAKNGIYIGKNLLVTFETLQKPLDMKVVEQMLKEFIL